MTDFSWIQDELSSKLITYSCEASFIKLTRAEIAARSGLPLGEVIPALKKWVHSSTVNHAIAWSAGGEPNDIVIIANTGVGASRSASGSEPRTQRLPSWCRS